MNENIPDCDELLRKFAGIFSAPKHVQRAYLEDPILHKLLSSAGGKSTAAKRGLPKPTPKAKPMKQMTFDDKLDAVPHEEGLGMIQDIKNRIKKADDSNLSYLQKMIANNELQKSEKIHQAAKSRYTFDIGRFDHRLPNAEIPKIVQDLQNKDVQKIKHRSLALIGGATGGLTGLVLNSLFKKVPTSLAVGGGALVGGGLAYGGSKVESNSINKASRADLKKYIKDKLDMQKKQDKSYSGQLGKDLAKSEFLLGPATLASYLGTAGAGVASQLASISLPKLNQDTLKQLVQNSGVEGRTAINPPNKTPLTFAAHFDPGKGLVRKFKPTGELGTIHAQGFNYNPATIAHELGHANIEGSRGLAGILQRKVYGPTMLANRFYLGGLANSLGSYYASKDEDNIGKGALKGGLASGLLNAGVLVPEFEASRRGIQNLLKTNLSGGQKLKNSLALMPAFLTYLLSTAGVGAGVGALHARSNKKGTGKKKVKTGELLKLAKSPVLRDLIKAKKLSDKGDYVHKNELIRKLVSKYPEQFKVDSYLNQAYVGLTHKPSGFKIHTQKSGLPSELFSSSY
jgi:hypothetical protein